MLCKPQHNQAWVSRQLTLCSFGILVPWISLWSDLLHRLNCHVDKQPVLRDLFFAGLCTAGNSRQGVGKSRHNSTTKPLIQNSSILFQDSSVLSLHCTFQSLTFSDCGDMRNSYLAEWLTNTHGDYRGSAHRGITTIQQDHQNGPCFSCTEGVA